MAALMGAIDTTIMAVALPQLRVSLDSSVVLLAWTLTIYQIVQMVMYPVAGRLSDALGRTRVLLACVVTFTIASLLCGFAPNVGTLIALRGIQAVGAGGLLPSAVGIVAERYPARRAQAVGLISSVLPIGAILGPTVGGLILQYSTWRALFWINVPIGVIVIAGVLLTVGPGTDRPRHSFHVDVQGLALYSAAILVVMYGLSAMGEDSTLIGDPRLYALFAGAVALAVAFVWHVRRTKEAIMDFTLLARNPFLAANLYNAVFGAVVVGPYSFLPLFAVVRYGLSPFESGAVLTPRALVVVGTSLLSSLVILPRGYRLPLLAGVFLSGVTLLLLGAGVSGVHLGGLVVPDFWWLAGVLCVGGVGLGLANPAANNAVIDLAPDQAAAITGIRSMFKLAGGAISISAVSVALSFSTDPSSGLSRIFLVLAACLTLALPLALMIPDAPHQIGAGGQGTSAMAVATRRRAPGG